MDNYSLLLNKLDQFIRKYYLNQLFRGFLFSAGLILGLFLAFNLLEHQFFFDNGGRRLLFLSFIGISSVAILYWIAIPLMRYFRLGKIISHEQAAAIIGQHFENVQDRLLNILQLKRQSEAIAEKALIEASIAQKSASLNPISFKRAIDLNKNRKYLKYALPPFLLLLLILFGAPSIITDSTHRIIHNGEDFERAAPFHFRMDDEALQVMQYDDFVLDVEIEGEQIPEEVFIDVENYQYRLTKTSKNQFSYTFNNVQKSQSFQLFSGTVKSDKEMLEVLPKPNLVDFSIELDYPNYIQRKSDFVQNIGDMVVPIGTKLRWSFNTHNAEQLQLKFSSQPKEYIDAERKANDSFSYRKTASKEEIYTLYIANEYLPKGDSISYALGLIPDQFPTISAQTFEDSLESAVFYFIGNASDDYGLSSLSFHYQLVDEGGVEIDSKVIKIADPESKEIQYDYLFDVNELMLKPGQRVNYFFEVYDNDGYNGRKAARTNLMTFAKPTVDEYKELEDENEEDIKDKLEESLDEIKKLQEELRKMREKLLQEKELDWQNKKELEKLLEKQKDLEDKIQEAKEKFDENLENQNEFSEQPEEIQEKQQQLQELFEELVDDESKELMDKIQDLLEELNKENSIQMLEEFEMNEEAMEKNMDRLLELFKQLEMEKEINDLVEDLNELAEEQEDLSEETKNEKEENADENNADPGEEEKEQSDQEMSEEEQGVEDQENSEEKKGDKEEEGDKKEENSDEKSTEEEKQEQQEKADSEEKKEKKLTDKQEDINEKFEDLKEKMEDIEEMNEELEFPKDLGDRNEEGMEEIQDELNESMEQLQQQQNQKASKAQKNAAQKMKSMAGTLQSQMQQGEMEQMQEDLKTLRQLLENIVTLSFDQESLVNNFNRTNINTPKYVSLVQDQFKIKDDFQMVEDSLQALSKRVAQIETFVTEKVTEINFNLTESIDKLEERQKPTASQFQRFTMKNLNDLALMLSESMNNMQQQMASMMQGNQMCNKPGQNNGQQGKSGQVPMDKITEGQQQLKEGLEKMMDGQKGGKGGTAKEFAESAARQAALRKALEGMQKMNEEQGRGTSQELQEIIDQMDQNEIDLVNKRLNNEMMARQQEILTRLLEAEKAEMQREYENKRKAETGREIKRQLPPSLEEFLKEKEAETDMYKSISPSLKPYYKQLVEEYYKALKSKSSR